MRVALDLQLAVGSATGIGEYAKGLADALPAAGVDVAELSNAKFDPWRFDRRVIWDQVLLPFAARRARADVLHCASGTMPVWSPLPIVVTVHDVAWLRVQSHARPYARWYFGGLAMAQYRRARRVIVDSEFSREELTSAGTIDPARIDVVYPGVAGDVAEVERRPEPEPMVLVVGTVERRKNLAVVIRAIAGLPGVRVVSVGPATDYRAICERIAAECRVADRVEFRGYVSRAELLDFYARAGVVAVPSVYEGFGYAAAWSLCAGAPLVAAAGSSLREVVGDAAPLVDPNDVAGWRDAIGDALAAGAQAGARAQAVRAGAIARFSWSTAAQAVAHSYARALDSAG